MDWFDIIAFWVPTAVFCVLAFMAGLVFSGWLEHDYKKHWKEWKIKFPLKPLYIGIALVIFVPLVILFSNLLSDVAGIPTNKMITPDQVRTLAIAFVGTISGIGALFGVYLAILRSEENKRQNEIAKSQADTAEQGLITDRINKATEGLGKSDKDGNPVIEVRLGTLYALERIAQDSERDHVPIMELFCAYIRTNSSNDDKKATTKPLREDIKIILRIIGRRDKWTQGKNRLKLEQTQEMRLHFYNCYLEGAELRDANLSGANFYKANLEYAWLNGANLSGARLLDAKITHAKLTGAKMSDAYARTGNFLRCPTLSQEQLDVMYCGIGVKIPNGLNRPNHWPTNNLNVEEFKEAYKKWLKEKKKKPKK